LPECLRSHLKVLMVNWKSVIVQLEGSSIGPWIELCKGKDIYKFAVSIGSAAPMRKGTTNYFAPVFSLSANITPETEQRSPGTG
jgi:hypothetical protein